MTTIHFISGLGSDERVFRYLSLPGVRFRHISWVPPGENETLGEYCRRLVPQIDTSREIILAGVSFGGIVARELACLVKVHKLILISSIKSTREFGWQLRMVQKLKLYKVVPSPLLKWLNSLTASYYFSVESADESKLLSAIIRDTDRRFMKWAITRIMNWKLLPDYPGTLHIHGSADRIFPVQNIRNYVGIEGAGHFMIVNRAKEISEIILREIQKTKKCTSKE